MLKLSPKNLLVLFLIIISIGSYILWAKGLENPFVKLLSITLGEDIHVTQAHSTADLRISKHEPRETDLFAIVQKPTIFEYRHPKLGFKLPPTKLVLIGTENSRVIDVESYPQPHLLNLKDSKVLLKKLLKFFDDIGWQRDTSYTNPDPDDLREEDFTFVRHEIVVGAWVDNDTHLHVEIKQNLTKIEIEQAADLYKDYYADENYYLVGVALYTKSQL